MRTMHIHTRHMQHQHAPVPAVVDLLRAWGLGCCGAVAGRSPHRAWGDLCNLLQYVDGILGSGGIGGVDGRVAPAADVAGCGRDGWIGMGRVLGSTRVACGVSVT